MRRQSLAFVPLWIGITLASAAFLLWVRARTIDDDIHYSVASQAGEREFAVDACSIDGNLLFTVFRFTDSGPTVGVVERGFFVKSTIGWNHRWGWPIASLMQFERHGRWSNGFGVLAKRTISTVRGTEADFGIAIPDLAFVAGFLGMGFYATRRRLNHARLINQGCCPECNYDLRASCDRCPECGWNMPPNTDRLFLTAGESTHS